MSDSSTLTREGVWPSLGDVTANLDPEVLRVVRASDSAWAPVREVVVLDTADAGSVQPDAIVLGVGLSGGPGGQHDTSDWVRRAGREGAAAVVLRLAADVDPEVLAAAEAAEIALLAVPAEMPWGQAYSLLRTSMLSAGARDRADTAGVPVGDLFALADAIAAAVEGPVTIEDPQWRVLAFSNLGQDVDEVRRKTILGRAVPAEWQRWLEETGAARALRTGSAVVRIEGPDGGFLPRLCAPVRAGSELLGTIWAAEGDVALGEKAERTLERAAGLAALHLICHRASEDVKRRTRGAFMREVLDGRVPAAAAAADSPLRANAPLTVLAFEAPAREATAPSVDPERILNIVSLYCEDAHVEAVCAMIDDRFWGLVPMPRTEEHERSMALAHRIVERVEHTVGVPLRAGVGVSVDVVADVPRSRRTAEQALRVLAHEGGARRVAHIDDVQAAAVLLELLAAAEGRPSLLAGKLQTLVAHDGDTGTVHVETLRAYLAAWGDIAETARRLDLHANTVRYRIRRLEEVSGLDLHDPDERFVTELQLRLLAHLAP